MLTKLYSIRPQAWIILSAMLVLSVVSVVVRSTDVVPSQDFLYFIQPAMALSIFGLTVYFTHDTQDRIRHRGDKAFLVGSVLAVWFVLYFLSGLATTFVHNSLVAGPRSIIINLWTYGLVAYLIEYSRHGLTLLVRRSNVIWFGMIITVILALQQMNFGLIPITHGLDGYVKLAISDFVPAIVSSFLLTYLAITGGLPTMLVYRLGLVATVILPPIIPKQDWYLQGVSLVLLSVGVYIAVDRTRQDRQADDQPRRRRHPRRAYDIMLVVVMIFMILFMIGVFTYKPAAIASNSMKPVFARGSIVIVQKIRSPMDVRVGDIVQYTGKDETITHRVASIEPAADGSGKTVFITKGDNNPSKDPTVTESQIKGIVRAEIPLIGYPTVWLKDASGSGIVKP